MGEYDKSIATAKKLIARKGQLITWRQLVDGSPADPAKPWLPSSASPVDFLNISMVFLVGMTGQDITAFTQFEKGTEVPRGALIGFMAQQSFEPTLKDVVIRGGSTLRVVALGSINPASDTILHYVALAT